MQLTYFEISFKYSGERNASIFKCQVSRYSYMMLKNMYQSRLLTIQDDILPFTTAWKTIELMKFTMFVLTYLSENENAFNETTKKGDMRKYGQNICDSSLLCGGVIVVSRENERQYSAHVFSFPIRLIFSGSRKHLDKNFYV